MLEIRHLHVGYGEVAVLRDLSLDVRQGEIVTLIGGNGAGKSTLLRAISALVRCRSGEIRFEGSPIGDMSPDAIVRAGIVHVPEGRKIFPQLSVEDNLLVGAHTVRGKIDVSEGIERVFAIFPRLQERRRQLGETLSGGEQQMLALGRAIISRPKLLLLDEPSLGLAPRIVEDVARAIVRFRREGMTILLVEQNARVALAISDRGYVIETGRIVLTDSARELARAPQVIASYLGGGASVAADDIAHPV